MQLLGYACSAAAKRISPGGEVKRMGLGAREKLEHRAGNGASGPGRQG